MHVRDSIESVECEYEIHQHPFGEVSIVQGLARPALTVNATCTPFAYSKRTVRVTEEAQGTSSVVRVWSAAVDKRGIEAESEKQKGKTKEQSLLHLRNIYS